MKILPVLCCICAVILLGCSPKEPTLPKKENVKNSKKPVEKHILSTKTHQKPEKTAENEEKNVILRGKAFYDNGTVVSEFLVSAIPRGADELISTVGQVKNRTISTEPDGIFEISGLQEAFYTLDLLCKDAVPIQTNLQIIAEESFLDLEFIKAPSVSGMVILAESGDPVPDVTVHFTSQSSSLPPLSVTTDNNGEFSLAAPVSQKLYGILTVKEIEYAPVQLYIRPSNVYDKYVITLRKTGIITGRVINQFDKPVKGVFVETRPRKWIEEKTNEPQNTSSPEEKHLQRRYRDACQVRSETPTDEVGQFVISNAAAPAMHGVHAEWLNNLHYKPGDHVFVTVTQGEIASVELRIIEKPNLLLKVRDSKGTPVLDYNLAIKSRTEHTYMSSGRHVIHRTDTWERVTVGIQESVAKGILNLAVTAPSGGRAVTNNIVCLVGTTNCVVLVLDDSEPVTVAGVIMTTDGTPVADNDMHANYSLGSLRSRTDHTGTFFFENISAETNSFITLGCIYNGDYYSTNVCISTKFIEWKLPKIPMLKGRVCIESEENPAKEFIIQTSIKNKINTSNGWFSQKITFAGAKTLSVVVDGYAPVQKWINAEPGADIDLGTIIVYTKAGTVKGRVIDAKGRPYETSVSLKSGNSNQINMVSTSRDSGTYIFKNVAPSNYHVGINTKSWSLKSKEFILAEGQTIEVPDMVVVASNKPLVTLLFLLPDGTPAADALVSFSLRWRSKRTSDMGVIITRLDTATYDKCPIKLNGKEFYSSVFKITPETEELTIQLHEMSAISGRALLNREPIDGKTLLLYSGSREYRVPVRNGSFSLHAPPGEYVVMCDGLKLSTYATLNASENNTIELFSGTSSCKIIFPFKGKYSCSIHRDFGGRLVYIHSKNISQQSDPVMSISDLSSGNYIFRLEGTYNNTNANIEVKIVLNKNEDKVITLP